MSFIDPNALVPQRKGIPRVLIVDDEPDLRELLELTVVKMGFDVETAGTLTEARRQLAQHAFALCLTDMRLPDGDGIELVSLVGEQLPETQIAVITAFGNTEIAVAALKAGAFDFLSKPVALDQLRLTIQAAVRQQRELPRRAAATPSPVVAAPAAARTVLGASAAMQDVRSTIERLARSMAPVAIYGESGTGKEVAARAIHTASARADRPFVAVNCGAIPENLMEAEFFGYRKGAFTGADTEREGFFQAANGGTLLLDEIAELPITMQVKLLRAIQERRVRRVGATSEEPVDVRIISATHRNLPERVAAGLFRQDLFYRLNVIELRMPPLRERPEDIPVLAQAILARLAASEGRHEARQLSARALERLQHYGFPGNVRELENVLERASAFALDDTIDADELGIDAAAVVAVLPEVLSDEATSGDADAGARDHQPEEDDGSAFPVAMVALWPEGAAAVDSLPLPCSLPQQLEAVERAIIERALAQTRYNRTAAAKLLGVTFRQLRYRIQQLGIK